MVKSGIPDGGYNGREFSPHPVGVVETSSLADGRPHAKDRVHRPQVQTQSIAADVARVDSVGRAWRMA